MNYSKTNTQRDTNSSNRSQIGLVSSMQASLPTQETPIRAGLSFTPSYRLVLTGRHYVVPFILKEEDVFTPLYQAINLTSSLAWNIDHMSTNFTVVAAIKHSLGNFDKEFHKLLDNLKDFLRYAITADPSRNGFSMNIRKKRGMINFLGSLSNILFGTATQAQIDAIHKKIAVLDSLTEKERILLNVHSTTLNVTIRNMNSMHAALDRLSSAVNISHNIIRKFTLKTLELQGEQKLFQALLDLELALGHISTDILDFKLGLQALLQTYVTPTIVSDKQLLEILQEASFRPPGLLFPAVPDYLAIHRDMLRVTSRSTASTSNRNFYFSIPLRGDPPDVFDVFRIDSLPFSLPNSTFFVQHEVTSKYIAFTENRKLYFLLSGVEQCSKHDDFLVCNPTSPIYEASNTATCESAAFLNQQSMFTLCQTTIVNYFSPVFIKGPTYWTYSVASPLTLTLTCPTNAINKHKIVVNGTGLLTLQQGCTAHNPAITLPSSDTYIDGSPITISHSPLHLPSLSEILPWPLNGSDLPDIPYVRSAQYIPLQELSARLQPLVPVSEPTQSPQSAFYWWIIIALCAVLVLMLAASGVGHWYVLRYAPRRQTSQHEISMQTSAADSLIRSQGRDLPEREIMLEPRN